MEEERVLVMSTEEAKASRDVVRVSSFLTSAERSENIVSGLAFAFPLNDHITQECPSADLRSRFFIRRSSRTVQIDRLRWDRRR